MKCSEKQEIIITRNEPNLDRACDMARKIAVVKFKIDENGHAGAPYSDYERSRSALVVEFKTLKMFSSMAGLEIQYVFDAWLEKC